MKNNLSATVVLIIVGIVLFIYLPKAMAPPRETYWIDECSSLDGWMHETSGSFLGSSGGVEAYSENYNTESTCIRMWVTSTNKGGHWERLTKNIGQIVPSEEGDIPIVLGFTLKAKKIVGDSYYGGGLNVIFRDAYGNTLNQIQMVNTDTYITNRMGQTSTHNPITLNQRVRVELAIRKDSMILTYDGVEVGSNTFQRDKIAPTSVTLELLSNTGVNTNEVLIDSIYVTSNPSPPFPWMAILVALIGLYIIFRKR